MKKKNVSKKVAILTIALIVILCMPVVNFAHSGRTDSSGGHKDNKNVSGLGSYHYHCGGNPAHLHTGGVCPYSSAASTPAPASSSSSSPSVSKTTTPSSTTSTTPKTVSVAYIDIAENDFEILIGETKELSATVYPSNATNKKITWESSNEEVVKIDSKGEITALGIGDVIITAKASNGEEDNVKVTVKPIEISEIKLTETEINLKVDETATIQATILPENATEPSVEWVSENEEIASVENGIITAKSAGTTTITCYSKNGIKSEVLVTIEEEEIVVEEKEETEEVSASVVENEIDSEETINESSNGSGIGALTTVGLMVGVPAYVIKSKKKK